MIKGKILTIRKMFSFLFLLDLDDDFFQFLCDFLIVRVCWFHTDDSLKKIKKNNKSVKLLHPSKKIMDNVFCRTPYNQVW